MSSWSCPHLDTEADHCGRLNQPCVPGRPGCVMPRTLVFATPVDVRIRLADEQARVLGKRDAKAGPVTRETAKGGDQAVDKDTYNQSQTPPSDLAREVIEAHEDAKFRGLCEDGALEAAAERVRRVDATSTGWLLRRGMHSNGGVAKRLFGLIPPERATEQPGGVTNHPAWTIAHLRLYHPAILALARGQSVCDPGEHPDPGAYPSWAQLVARFNEAHAQVHDALRRITCQTLARSPGLERWTEAFGDTAPTLQYLLVHHEAVHRGELTVWCRAAGLLPAGPNP